MNNIPLNRLVIYILIIGIIPLFALVYFQTQRHQQLDNLNFVLCRTQNEIIQESKKQLKNVEVAQRFSHSDPDFLEHNIENLVFLKNEVVKLQDWIETSSFLDTSILENRINYLSNDKNKLCFRETQTDKFKRFNETTEILQHPVEVDCDDLINLLLQFENNDSGPQFLITDLKLERKTKELQQEVFSLDLQLIKREYFQ